MNFQPSTTNSRHTVYIGLGANQPSQAGSESETLLAAVSHLELLSDEPVLLSSLYISDPVDCAPGTQDFVNAVARLAVSSSTSPQALLIKLQQIEALFGRQRESAVNAPRPLDLDMICFGDVKLQSETLTLPHPRAIERLFVLVPLQELCSTAELGGLVTDIASLIKRLPKSPGLKKL